MKQSYIYAALLLHEEGKEITAESIMDIIKAAGAEPNEAYARSVAESLNGVDIESVIQSASLTMAAPAAAPAPAEAKEEEEKKEEKEEEEKEESVEGLAALFG